VLGNRPAQFKTAPANSLRKFSPQHFFKMVSKIKQFISEVRTELMKASWPWDPKERGFKRYKELTDSTMVVVVAMLLLAGYISFCDLCLTSIIGALTRQ
jgi:preprotein translocase subunit SecE